MSTQADVLATVDGAPPPAAAPATDPAIKALEAKIAEQGNQLSAVTRALQSRPAATSAPATQPPAQNKEQLRQEFFKEPMDMAAAIAYRAAQDVMSQGQGQTIETLKQIARDKVRSQDPDLFDKYSHEIDAMVAQNTAPQFHGNINVWQSAANMVYGAHRREIAAEPAKPGAPAVHIKDGPAAPNTRQASPPPKQQLTEDEKRVARGLGLSEEAYLRGKNRIEKVGEVRWQSKDDAFDDGAVLKARKERRAAAGK